MSAPKPTRPPDTVEYIWHLTDDEQALVDDKDTGDQFLVTRLVIRLTDAKQETEYWGVRKYKTGGLGEFTQPVRLT